MRTGLEREMVETVFKIEIGTAVETMKIEPGDVLLLKVEHTLTTEQADALKAVVKRVFPNNDVMVLSSGVTLTRLEISATARRADP